MPAGPPGPYEERAYNSSAFHPHHQQHQQHPQQHQQQQAVNNNNNDVSAAELNGDESAASILQSVKEQEAQFEQLTRELEAERQSVATQLERCKLGSETASMSSISSTDESFHWRQQPAALAAHHHTGEEQAAQLQHVDEESDAESKMSGSQLVDSCFGSMGQSGRYQLVGASATTMTSSSRRVLQERGLMNVGEDPLEYLQDDPNAPPRPPPSSEHYTPTGYNPHKLSNSNLSASHLSNSHLNNSHSHLGNGPYSSGYDRSASPNPSLQSAGSRGGHHLHQNLSQQPIYHQQQPSYGSGGSPLPADTYPPGYNSAVNPATGNLQQGGPRPYSPAASSQGGRGTPTRFPTSPYYSDSRYPGDASPRYHSQQHEQQTPDSGDALGPGLTHSHIQSFDGGTEPYGSQSAMPQYDPTYRSLAPDPYGRYQQPSPRDTSYDQYPGPGGDRPPPGAGPQSYTGSPYMSRVAYDDPQGNMYRATPPADGGDSYRRLPNGSYSNMSATDRYRNTPPIDGGAADPYRDIPAMDDDRFDPNRPPSERGDAYMGHGLEDDQYADARPMADTDRYGRPLQDGRSGQTPSPAPGSDRPVLPQFPFPREGFGYPGTFGYHGDENPYSSRTALPATYGSPDANQLGHRFDDASGPGSHVPYGEHLVASDPYGGSGPVYTHEYNPNDGGVDSPSGHPMPDRGGGAGGPPRAYENLGPPNIYGADDGMPRIYNEDDSRMYSPDREDESQLHGAPPEDYDPNRRSPSVDSETRDQRWRNPDLPEVIDFLSHSSNAIKANAAAYLQHLCYMDDGVKAKTRGLGGIPSLVELVNNEIPEVHRAACGALRNLSFGRANDENKRAIKNADGIPSLIRLLRTSPDNDIRELVTGILWNLSSCQDLKKHIIDDGLTVIVNNVIIPHSGWDRNLDEEALRMPREVYWSTVFRNASGILRNISSDAEYARKKLRECEGLVDAVFYIVRAAIGKNDIDNKSVENCVCVLRNLSYACQEVEDPSYLKRRNQPKPAPIKGETTGCFGGNKKKKDPQKIDQRGRADSGYQSGRQNPSSTRPRSEPVRGMELLWQPDVVSIYLPLLSDCSNPETLEAAAGAIQNLAACDWQPSVDIRAAVRKERGLPIIVELLTVEADRVVCAAATALRNLALDHRNKELIGKYAMRQLVMKLPQENKQPDFPVSDDTVTAVQATLYEVVKKNADFAQSLLSEGGVERLVHITKSRGKYSNKVVKFASSILYTMWQFRELHPEYKNRGWKEQHFVTRTMAARGGPSASANNTLNRPRMDLGGGHPPSSATHSEPSSPGSNQRYHGNSVPPGTYADPGHTPDSGRYRDDRLRPEDIPMQQMGSAADMPSPGYASIESPRSRDDYRPAGGVPMYPNHPGMGPGGQQPQPQVDSREPLYAQVNKPAKRRPDGGVMLDQRQADGGADSWV